MRTAYHEQLAELSERLGEMCGLAGIAMERATQALLQADLVLAEQVITDHERISALSAQAEESAFVLLALQAPVAGDLRSIVSAIQIVADIDRMGALALHVAKIARRRTVNVRGLSLRNSTSRPCPPARFTSAGRPLGGCSLQTLTFGRCRRGLRFEG